MDEYIEKIRRDVTLQLGKSKSDKELMIEIAELKRIAEKFMKSEKGKPTLTLLKGGKK